MLIRFALLVSTLLIASSAVMCLITHDSRYQNFAWHVVRFIGYVVMVFLALYLLERYGLVAWGVLF